MVHLRVRDSFKSTNTLVNSVLEIPLDKELIVKCLVETRTKLWELIRTAMVLSRLISVFTASWLEIFRRIHLFFSQISCENFTRKNVVCFLILTFVKNKTRQTNKQKRKNKQINKQKLKCKSLKSNIT